MKNILSITIPTRNREVYINQVVDLLLRTLPQNVQIVVSDNSDRINDVLANIVLHDPRLIYVFESKVLSFSQNFNKCINYCTGDFITAIGDDDLVFPWVIDYLIFAKENDIDSLVYDFDAIFYWPGIDGRTSESKGLLKISKPQSSSFKKLQQDNILNSFLKNGVSGFPSYPLVRIYHGIVSREIVCKAISQSGKLYSGLSPDIYSSIVLSLLAKKSHKCPVPLTLPGICKSSGSGQSATGKHRGRLVDAPHFRGNANYEWNLAVPKFYSVNTIWAESAIKALSDFSPACIGAIDNNKFLAISFLENFSIAPEIVKAVYAQRKITNNRYYCFPSVGYLFIKELFSRVIRRLKSRRKETTEYLVDDISCVSSIAVNSFHPIGSREVG